MYQHAISRGTLLAGLAALFAFTPGCQTSQPQTSPPVLTPKTYSPQTFADYSPDLPYRPLAPGLMARTRYVAETRGPNHVEVWELLAGPGQKSGAVTLPGAAVLEINAGQGVITAAGKPQEVRAGQTISLDEGVEISVENRTPGGGLMIRATLIRRAAN